MITCRWTSGDGRYTITRDAVEGPRINGFFVSLTVTYTCASDEGLTSNEETFEDAVHWCAEDSRRRRGAPPAADAAAQPADDDVGRGAGFGNEAACALLPKGAHIDDDVGKCVAAFHNGSHERCNFPF